MKTQAVVRTVLLVMGLGAAAWADDFRAAPRGHESSVAFWTDVFTKYSRDEMVVHDDRHLDKVYSVVRLPSYPEGRDGNPTIRRQRQKIWRDEKERIEALLRSVDRKKSNPGSMTAEERRVFKLFADQSSSGRFRAAIARVRGQNGIRERFRQGLEKSGAYFPAIERIFREEGVPTPLARLPLIESSFDVQAYSKVGAAGVWQFMPGSARIYGLRLDEIVDERLDPLRAARAAARHLRSDYEKLGSWPLAVTAYNHGPAGMARAVRQTGSKDLATIIGKYRSRRFGFASRNFYVELVAAIRIDENPEAYFPGLQRVDEIAFDEIDVNHFVSFRTLSRLAQVDEPTLAALNPGFRREVVENKLYVPPDYRVRIPPGRVVDFRLAYQHLSPSERHAEQRRYFVEHRVRPGEAVSTIARRYGTSSTAIARANGLSSVHRIRAGQVLKVPTGGNGAPVPSAPVAVASSSGRHRVRSGETLGSIAGRYGTSVAALQSLNGIRDARRLQIGQELAIPGGTTKVASSSHRVRSGETLGAIAQRYGTDVSTLVAVNEIADVKALQIGQSLAIPSGGAAAERHHRVRHGETLGAIARRYGTTARDLQAKNDISDRHRIQVGQTLLVP